MLCPAISATRPIVPLSSIKTKRHGCELKWLGAAWARRISRCWSARETGSGKKGPLVVRRDKTDSINRAWAALEDEALGGVAAMLYAIRLAARRIAEKSPRDAYQAHQAASGAAAPIKQASCQCAAWPGRVSGMSSSSTHTTTNPPARCPSHSPRPLPSQPRALTTKNSR